MFKSEEIQVLSTFFNISQNTEDTLLILENKQLGADWLIVDFGERFADRIGVYIRKNKKKPFRSFSSTESIQKFLKLASDNN